MKALKCIIVTIVLVAIRPHSGAPQGSSGCGYRKESNSCEGDTIVNDSQDPPNNGYPNGANSVPTSNAARYPPNYPPSYPPNYPPSYPPGQYPTQDTRFGYNHNPNYGNSYPPNYGPSYNPNSAYGPNLAPMYPAYPPPRRSGFGAEGEADWMKRVGASFGAGLKSSSGYGIGFDTQGAVMSEGRVGAKLGFHKY